VLGEGGYSSFEQYSTDAARMRGASRVPLVRLSRLSQPGAVSRALGPALNERHVEHSRPVVLLDQLGRVSSIAGLVGSPYLTPHPAGKWAVRGMTKAAAKELASSGVRVNSLHPGQIDTDVQTRQRERTPELVQRLVASIPMQRIGDPGEVAEAACSSPPTRAAR
jgi:NAD(P)-dependent dehydrogenase (short-subunit alcohol dehydrogenase family)